MLFDPKCFVDFVEDNNVPVVEYIDNWADIAKYYFFDDLVIDMTECIHIEVAKMYLKKLEAIELIDDLNNLNCPCTSK